MARRQGFGDLPISSAEKSEPPGEVNAEGNLVRNWRTIVFDHGFKPLPFDSVEPVEGLKDKTLPPASIRGHHITDIEFAADSPAVAKLSDGVPG